MKFKKLLLTFVFLIGSLLGLTSCKQEVLTVYTEVGFAPFEYVSNGEISGVDIDIMNMVGEKLGKKVVFENVAFALEVTDTPKKLIRNKVRKTLEIVGLSDKANAFPNQLSGGQQQRVAIARAIVNSPKVLIADEPTGNLDPETSEEIIQVLHKINEEGTTVLVVTHDKYIVEKYKKRTILIDNGCVTSDTSVGGYNTL